MVLDNWQGLDRCLLSKQAYKSIIAHDQITKGGIGHHNGEGGPCRAWVVIKAGIQKHFCTGSDHKRWYWTPLWPVIACTPLRAITCLLFQNGWSQLNSDHKTLTETQYWTYGDSSKHFANFFVCLSKLVIVFFSLAFQSPFPLLSFMSFHHLCSPYLSHFPHCSYLVPQNKVQDEKEHCTRFLPRWE